MATPDFTYKPDATIIAAFQQAQQQRMQQEQLNMQKKQQEFKMVQDTTKAVSDMVSSMVGAAQERTKRNLVNSAKEILAKPEPAANVPVEGPMLPTAGISETSTTQERPMGVNPEVLQRNKARMDIANALAPKEFGEQMAKAAMPDANKPQGQVFQQSSIQVKGADGRPKTLKVNFDQRTGKYHNPLTGAEITDFSKAEGLPEAGYAQSVKPSGFTAEGEQVFSDARSGAQFTMDAEGNPTPYEGTIFPKLENVPSGITDALTELNYSQKMLKEIDKSFNPDFVGPIAARAGKMSKYVDELTDEQRVEFYGNVAEYKNSIIKAITGAQMSELEAKRIIQQIPDENSSPTAFRAGLKRAFNSTKRRLDTKQEGLKKGGYTTRGDFATEEMLTEELDKKLPGQAQNKKGDRLQQAIDRINELKKKAAQ